MAPSQTPRVACGAWYMIQFKSSRGDRSNVQNVAVVIADDFSNLDENLLGVYNELADVS